MFLPAAVMLFGFVAAIVIELLRVPGADIRVALSASFAAFAPHTTAFNVVWWGWIVGGWFLNERAWKQWKRLFPKADFQIGANKERSLALGRVRMAIISGIFAMLIAPYAVPMLASLF